LSEATDQQLIAGLAARDQRALLHLYDRYAAKVLGLATRMLGEPMAAEEVTQDVFLKLWAHADRYIPTRGAVSTWLLTIARRTALDRLRAEQRRPPLNDEVDPEETWSLLPDQSSQGDEARWHALSLAVAALPPTQRQPIELAFYRGLSHSEVAKTLGWPIGTVKTRIRLGMAHLRKEWMASD
jgi:RNA polymerase sigma-70 factor (ECF subfamily)